MFYQYKRERVKMLKDSPLRKEKKLEHYQLLRIEQKLKDDQKNEETIKELIDEEESNNTGTVVNSKL